MNKLRRCTGTWCAAKKFTKQSKFAFVSAGASERASFDSAWKGTEFGDAAYFYFCTRGLAYRRLVPPAFVLASHTGAASLVVDPGWQLGSMPGSPDTAATVSSESMFGDATGQPVVARAYQPATVYQPGADAAAAGLLHRAWLRRSSLVPPQLRLISQRPPTPAASARHGRGARWRGGRLLSTNACATGTCSTSACSASACSASACSTSAHATSACAAGGASQSGAGLPSADDRCSRPPAQPVPCVQPVRRAGAAARILTILGMLRTGGPRLVPIRPGELSGGARRRSRARFCIPACQPQYPQPVPQQRVAFAHDEQHKTASKATPINRSSKNLFRRPIKMAASNSNTVMAGAGICASGHTVILRNSRPIRDTRPLSGRRVSGRPAAGHDHHRYPKLLSLSGARWRQSLALRHRRRPSGLHLGRMVKPISAKREWPDWHPLDEMLVLAVRFAALHAGRPG